MRSMQITGYTLVTDNPSCYFTLFPSGSYCPGPTGTLIFTDLYMVGFHHGGGGGGGGSGTGAGMIQRVIHTLGGDQRITDIFIRSFFLRREADN